MFDVLILQSPPSALKGHIYPRQSWKRSIQSRRGQFKSMAVFPAGSGETYLLCVSTLHTVKSFRWMHGIKYVVYIFIFIFFSAWFPQLWKTASVQEGVCKKYYQVFEVFYKVWSFTNETFFTYLSIIYNRCCDPYLKDVTSHAIKSVVMKKIYHRPSYFCNTFNLETNFQVNMTWWYYVSTVHCLSGLFCKSWRRCNTWFDSRHHFQQCQHFKVIENCTKN